MPRGLVRYSQRRSEGVRESEAASGGHGGDEEERKEDEGSGGNMRICSCVGLSGKGVKCENGRDKLMKEITDGCCG